MRKRTKAVIRICVLIVALGIGSVCLFWTYRLGRIDRVFDGSRVGNSDAQRAKRGCARRRKARDYGHKECVNKIKARRLDAELRSLDRV